MSAAEQHPKRLGRYEVQGELGVGGMATVYRARDPVLERDVALKVLHPHLRKAGEARTRFTREARAAAQLRHKHIVQIFDYSGEDSDWVYIAAELIEGSTLAHLVASHGPVFAEIAVSLVAAVAAGLGEAHRRGIVHRDIKPENILIDKHGVVKITDFGIAQVLDSHAFTATGEVLGTPHYMSPEQVRGERCDARSDVFSLGSVLYLLLTGRRAFEASAPHAVLRRIVDGHSVDVLDSNPAVGEACAQLLRQAMAAEKDARFADGHAFAQALSAFVSQSGLSVEELPALFVDAPERTASKVASMVVRSHEQRLAEAFATKVWPEVHALAARLLALDPGNAKALEALSIRDRVSRRRRLHRSMLATALALLVATAAVVALAWPWQPPERLQQSETSANRAREPGARSRQGQANQVGGRGARGGPASQGGSPQRGAIAANTPVTEGVPPRPGTADAAMATPSPGAKRTREANLPARRVILQPSPKNVSIAVDGGKPRAFGPEFFSLRLRPGVHRFAVTGAEGCCYPQVFHSRIPPGESPYTLELRLQYKPAGLYVATPVPAEVRVANGPSGRARELVSIPMERGAVKRIRVTVSAEGFADRTESLRVTAGRVTQARVQLQPLEPSPAAQ